MKAQILKIAGVDSEKEFYERYPTEESFFEAYPEARMMKQGGNVPTNPELWSRAKASAKQKYDVYPCVPLDAQALTKDGWKTYHQLTVGEEILSYNPETRLNEWTPILALQFFEDAPLIRLYKAQTNCDIKCTPNHKWMLAEFNSKYPDNLVEAKDITKHMQLLITAPLNPESTSDLDLQEFSKTDSWVKKVLQMSIPQVQAFFASGIVYDGHDKGLCKKGEKRTYGFSQKSKDHGLAMEIAAVLLGYRVCSIQKKHNPDMQSWTFITRNAEATQNLKKEEAGTADVWCPTTKNQTWVMKQNGYITITGNSAYANGFAAKWYKERGGGWKKAEMGGCMECGGQMAQGGPIAEYSMNPMEMFFQMGGQSDPSYQNSQGQPDMNAAIGEISRLIMEGDDPNEIYGMLIENGVEEEYALDIMEEAFENLEETDLEEEDTPFDVEEMREFEMQEERQIMDQLEEEEELLEFDPAEKMKMGGKIKIDPAKKGTFKAQATRMGMSVQEAASYILRHKDEYSPAMVKKANFAKNFAKELGGEIFDLAQYKDGGGIPQRYRNMGFSRVGAKKKSTRPGKKWMVLAKKGDQYKVVHGGWKGMQDFTQHRNTNRKKRFWDRMGGRDSAKAKDPFSPLYWHKRFGTWEEGGAITANYENTVANLAPNALNKTLMSASTLTDPRNMVWALPNRGFLGAIKGIAGAAAGLSGAGLGYSKLLGANNNPYSTTVKYQSGGQKAKTFQEWAAENPVFRRNDLAGYQNYLSSFVSSLNIDTPKEELPKTSSAAPMVPMSVKDAPNSATPFSQNVFQQMQRTPSIVANPMTNASVRRSEPIQYMQPRQVTQVLNTAPELQIKTEMSPAPIQAFEQTMYGDPYGQVFANSAIAGLGMLNDVLSQRNYSREYDDMMRRTGNTDNRYNPMNAANPFGNYTLNAGPASNFALVANTPAQDFGTTLFKEGGEYFMSDDEVQAILAMGGEIEYLD